MSSAGKKVNRADYEIAEIEQFWAVQGRYDTLARGVRSLLQSLKRSPEWLHRQQTRWAGGASKSTLRRFVNNDGSALANKSWELSILLMTCEKLITAENKNFESSDLVSSLIALARAHENISKFEKRGHVAEIGDAYDIDTLRFIYDQLVFPEGDDPNHPEFPPHSPRYPASPIIPEDIYGRTVYIKDESFNPTGSHKDRWAWEVLFQYKEQIGRAIKGAAGARVVAPYLSMISNGGAAFALQHLLRPRGLPSLRVVMDEKRANRRVRDKLEAFGAQIFLHDLDQDELTAEDVKRITGNPNGIDVTSRELEAAYRKNFYDWLCYEILHEKPDHIFVPVGTGDLFANIIYIISEESRGARNDRRLKGASIGKINVFGATTYNPKSQMDKLYAKFRDLSGRRSNRQRPWRKKKYKREQSGSAPAYTEFAKRMPNRRTESLQQKD
jgi:hypothetical protein